MKGVADTGAGWSPRFEQSPSFADSVFEAATDVVDSVKAYLASEHGREVRRVFATAVIVGAPLLSQLPVFRRTLLGRLLGSATVGALLVKGAEWLRDWEPLDLLDSFEPGRDS